uniref:Uncharacterized protein n=1 Tax=Glossina pallidipes TaxID=7398 RepID=A0A1B0AH73_GLOPL
MTKEVNSIDATEGARDDKNNKTIVDIIFEDFSTTPFNSPTASPERNLERSPLFILLEKPKRYYSRKEKVKSNLEEKFKAAIDDMNMNTCSSSLLQCKNGKHLLNDPISEDHCYDDIGKEDTYNVNETLVSSNQCTTGISKTYHWDEDDNDLFASISTQEILEHNEKINNNFPNISKFPVNKQITQGFQIANGKKISISEEGQKSVQNILREFQDNLRETDSETELKDIKARISNKSMESKFRKTANRKVRK